MSSVKTILLEEAIRTMAIVGIVMFGVLPVADVLGADLSRVAIIAFPAALLFFPITLLIRTRTGRDLRIHNRRAWYIATFIAFALGLAIVTLRASTGFMSWSQAVVWILASTLVIAVLAVLGARLMRLQ